MPKKLLYGVILAIVLVSVFLLSYLIFPILNQMSISWKAAVIDQLSIDGRFVNASFIDGATSILNSAGYNVETFSGEEIDVKFYEELPSNGYNVIVLRAHSAVREGSSHFVDLFTSEQYVEGKYLELGDQISRAMFFNSSGPDYFAIGPTFVAQSMKGEFSNTLITLMGCSSLNYTTMANALRAKGARVIIGWTKWILPSETDYFTTLLLQYLLNLDDPDTVDLAINRIKQELNRKPTLYGSRLTYYPTAEGNYRVPIRKESGVITKVKTDEPFPIVIRGINYDLFISKLKQLRALQGFTHS